MKKINDKEYKDIVSDILESDVFLKLRYIRHHGISRYDHLVRVSLRSYRLAKKFRLDYKSTARGALLHDFYLDGDERSNWKKFTDTFSHPKRALEASNKYFHLNKMEENIIISHMFPIYPYLPKYAESFLVNFVDKIIGGYEMVRYKFNIFYILKTKKIH